MSDKTDYRYYSIITLLLLNSAITINEVLINRNILIACCLVIFLVIYFLGEWQ